MKGSHNMGRIVVFGFPDHQSDFAMRISTFTCKLKIGSQDEIPIGFFKSIMKLISLKPDIVSSSLKMVGLGFFVINCFSFQLGISNVLAMAEYALFSILGNGYLHQQEAK